ncbi:MAG: hypothetical protein RI935_217 [Candidatus Parcubacteria bacterium]|jgi:HlyD family secretion protein
MESTSSLHNKLSFLKTIVINVESFLKEHITVTALLFVITCAAVFFGLTSQRDTKEDVFVVGRVPLTQSVMLTGSVQTSKEAKLSFETQGKVSFVNAVVGKRVKQGEVLATISAGSLQASVLEAEAIVLNRKATLAQLEQGSRKEELALKEQLVASAKSNLDQTYRTLTETIVTTEGTVADVIKNKLGSLFVWNGSQYSLSFVSCDQKLQGSIELKRTALENTMASFQSKSGTLSTLSSSSKIDTVFEEMIQVVNDTNEIVSLLSLLLLNSCSAANPSLDSYRASLSVVKTSMSTVFADIAAKRSTLSTSKNNYTQASRDLELSLAGSNPYSIKAQVALVSQAEAALLQVKTSLAKTILRAPFDGVVSEVDLVEGENVSVNTAAISLIAEKGFEIEAKIPEIDIAKVSTGQKVLVTLDAYGRDVTFDAFVSRINPTATIEGSVPLYKTIITFASNDERIKQGMTANVTIITKEKSSVYAVPARYVFFVSDKKGTVDVLKEGKRVTQDITIGIRGDKGMLEIEEGVVEGDIILPQETKERKAQKQNN